MSSCRQSLGFVLHTLLAALLFAACGSDTLIQPDTIPPAALVVIATANGNDGVDVTWTNPTDEDLEQVIIVHYASLTFAVEPRENESFNVGDSLGAGTVLHVGDGTTRSLSDTGLGCGDHMYAGWARDTSGNWSTGHADVVDVPALPDAVTDLVVTDTGTTVDVTWTDPVNDPHFSHTIVTRKPVSAPQHPYDGIAMCLRCSGGALVDALDPNSGTYYYAAFSCNTCGDCVSTATTASIDFGVSDVASATFVAGDTQVVISWTDPVFSDFAGVRVVQKLTNDIIDASDGTIVCDGCTSPAIDTGLVNNTTYYYGIFAHDSSSPVRYSLGVFGSAIPQDAPGPPDVTGASFTPGDTHVYLDWTLPTGVSISGVRVVFKLTNDITNELDGTLVCDGFSGANPCIMVYDHAGLVNGTTYYYKIFTLDPAGRYSGGVAGSATPVGDTTPPANVTAASFTPADSQVTINYTEPADLDFDKATIIYKLTNDIAGPTDGTTVCDPCASPVDHTGLTNGTTYYYRIITWDVTGNPSAGVDGSATPIADPTQVLFGDLGATGFGRSVDIDGDYLIIGAYTEDGGQTASGTAYVFHRTGAGSDWGTPFKLTPSDPEASAHYGWSVAIYGDTIVVGAQDKDELVSSVLQPEIGAAYVYERSGTNTWGNEQKLLASDPDRRDNFGSSLAIHQDLIVVGANDRDEGSANGAGAIYIFRKATTGNSWSFEYKLTASDAPFTSTGASFGQDVAVYKVSDTNAYVVAGAAGQDGSMANFIDRVGAVYVYHSTAIGSWGDETKLMAADGATADMLGRAVDIDGDYLVAGAWQTDGLAAQTNVGAAYVFHRTGTNTWDAGVRLPDSVESQFSMFGENVDIEGDTIMVGAERRTFDPTGVDISDAGYVHFYQRLGTNSWGNEVTIQSPNMQQSGYFGWAIGLSTQYAVIGASEGSDGPAYVLRYPDLF